MTHKNRITSKRQGNRGVALVISLLLLSLFMVLTLSMVIATTSDTLIDGYYRNARSSFYAADSGVNAVRQALLLDILNNALPVGYTPTNGSPTMTIQNSFPSDISSAFGSYQSLLGSSSSASATSWPGTFKLDPASTISMTCTPSPQCNNGSATPITVNVDYVYTYSYHFIVDGQSRTGEKNVVEEYGSIPYTVQMRPAAAPPTPFSNWSTFFNKYALCSAPLVPGTFTGKMFSNESFNYGVFATRYIFNGAVGVGNASVGYMYNDGTCDSSAATSDTYSGTTIAPTFSAGLSVSQTAIPLPTDTYSQEQAVLDGHGGSCAAGSCTNPAPTNAALAATLTDPSGTPWSTSASSGVYLPWAPASSGPPATPAAIRTSGTPAAFGGLYVQGNVDKMVLAASTSGTHKLQVMTITQGSTTTTVTLDLTGGTTEISDNHGHDSGALTGLPQNTTGSSPSEACMVYVTGNISSDPTATAPTGLSGPSSGAAIQDGSAVTITAGGTISVTGDIKYSTEPVSLNVSDTPVSPAPTNVLGIFTTGGNVQFQPPSDVSSMEVDASFATINAASGSDYGLEASWNGITTLNIVGGRVQNKARSGSALGARNIYFDQRFNSGFAPPWFPTTTLPAPPTDIAIALAPVAKRTSWVNSSAQ